MVRKNELLKHLSDYSPEEIAEAIREDIVTLYELKKYSMGAFTPLLEKDVEDILSHKSEESQKNGNQNNVLETSNNESETTASLSFKNVEPNTDESEINNTHIDSEINNKKPNLFSRPFSFQGRIRRTEYGLTLILSFFVDRIIDAIALSIMDTNGLYLYMIFIFFYIWFLLAQGAKRCHDLGNSGWFQFIPFYGLWMLFAKGEFGSNKYGNSPK